MLLPFMLVVLAKPGWIQPGQELFCCQGRYEGGRELWGTGWAGSAGELEQGSRV